MVLGFLLRFLPALTLLLLSWPWSRALYAPWFRGSTALVLQTFALGYGVECRPNDDPVKDTRVVFERRAGPTAGEVLGVDESSRWIGFAQACVFVALVLASAIPWKARLRALFLGLLALHLLVVLQIGLHAVRAHQAHFAGCPFPERHSALWSETSPLLVVLGGLSRAASELAIYYPVPLILWAVLCVPRASWRELLRRAPSI